MSRKEAEESFPAKFKYIVTSVAILGQSRDLKFYHLDETNYYCTFCFYMAQDFKWGQMHYKGHWKGWALKIETFLRPEIATSDAARVSD
jgi:hypothetical protein